MWFVFPRAMKDERVQLPLNHHVLWQAESNCLMFDVFNYFTGFDALRVFSMVWMKKQMVWNGKIEHKVFLFIWGKRPGQVSFSPRVSPHPKSLTPLIFFSHCEVLVTSTSTVSSSSTSRSSTSSSVTSSSTPLRTSITTTARWTGKTRRRWVLKVVSGGPERITWHWVLVDSCWPLQTISLFFFIQRSMAKTKNPTAAVLRTQPAAPRSLRPWEEVYLGNLGSDEKKTQGWLVDRFDQNDRFLLFSL